jgi:inner membrane transporter RhtA
MRRYEDRVQASRGLGLLNAVPAPIVVLGSVISVQFGAALARGLFPVVGPAGTVFLRLSVAIVCLYLLLRPDVFGLLRRHPWLIAAFGATIALSTVFFYIAVSRIPLGVAIALEFIGPLIVALRNTRRLLERAWVVLAGASVALLVPDIGTTLDGWGVAAALVAATFWGLYIVLAPRVAAVAAEYDGLVAALCIAWLILLIPGILQGGAALLTIHVLWQSIVMGIMAAVIPFTFDFNALKRLPPRIYGVLVCSEPIAGAIVGFLVLDERLTLPIIGAIAGVTIASIGSTLTHTEVVNE